MAVSSENRKEVADIWKKCGERIVKIRESRHISRDKLSFLIDTDYHNLGKIERGEHGMRIDRLIRIAEVLNISLDYLLLGKDKTAFDEKLNMIIMLLQDFTTEQLDDIFEIICRIKNFKK